MVSAHRLSAAVPRRRFGMALASAWAAAVALLGLWLSQAIAASPAETILRQLQAGAGVPATERNATDLALLAGFYKERQERLWVTDRGATPRAHQLASILQNADQDGLDPDDYGATAIAALLDATGPDALAELELRLSLGLIQFISDLASGRVEPSEVDPELFVYPQDIDHAAVIRAAADASDLDTFVAGFRPAQDEYQRARAALAEFRARAARGDDWGVVPEGPTLDPGMTDPRIAWLRARLLASSDAEEARLAAVGAAAPEFYDHALEAAVRRFQYRHGLEQDGRVGRRTIEALNVPIEQRIRQIVLNLERRRWMPDDRGERYVFVNLADFELKLVDGPRTVFDTRVVVGAPYHRTPVFSAEMTYVEINPYWNVPPSIARNELLPEIKADPGYLAANGFELLTGWDNGAAIDPWTIDWSRIGPENFAWRLRQKPGASNALGRIKFMFPNRFNVYLHDTPARHLFDRAERSFSHGCIRVEQPVTFGAFVLAGQDDWSRERLEAAIASGERMIVPLEKPLPVHIAYLTAWVNKDGTVHFRNDVYGRDTRLAAALLGPRA